MKRILLLSVLILSGCSVSQQFIMTGLTPPSKPYVTNRLKPDFYPGFMSAEGNIYSCRYGIHYMTQDEFTPPKQDIFASLMNRYIPTINEHDVTLYQFDVYINRRVSRLKTGGAAAGGAVGGIVGAAIGSSVIASANAQDTGISDVNLRLYRVGKDYPFKSNEKPVGCEGKKEGEYYPSNTSAGHAVIVIWVKFQVKNKMLHYRSTYQVPTETSNNIQVVMPKALNATFEAIANKIYRKAK